MAAVALCSLLYFPKFLSRMDQGHLYQAYSVTLPLALFIVYRFVEAAEGAVNRRRRTADRGFRRTPRQPGASRPRSGAGRNRLTDEINYAGALPAAVAAKPLKRRHRICSAVDPAPFRALERIINAYLAPRIVSSISPTNQRSSST